MKMNNEKPLQKLGSSYNPMKIVKMVKNGKMVKMVKMM